MSFAVGTPKQIVSVVQAILIVAVAARIVGRRRRASSRGPIAPVPSTAEGAAAPL
jgi:ABC-type uncharacterized transport system permease subunit